MRPLKRNSPKGDLLIDRLRHCHAEWRWRSAGVWAAYERWSRAGGDESTLEFAAYRVALDLEERACRRYMDLAERVARTRDAGAGGAAAAA